MKLVRSPARAGLADSGCALTIGNFDAVHLGHRQILSGLRRHADRLGVPAMVMTFDPHPEEYFRKGDSAPRLTDLTTRYFALRECGVDIMLSLRFDRRLASTDAPTFVREILHRQLAVRYLLIGDDFRFGRDRQGDFAMLADMAGESGFQLERTDTLECNGERVSSTRIRKLLADGQVDLAADLLGRSYALTGRVIRGQQLGRQWGFPTLNLAVHHKPALRGVFAVRVDGLGSESIPGVANLGTRPTVGGIRTLLEVHLFDFEQQVYGERICVSFVERIRPEHKFDSFDALKSQIRQDCDQARRILGLD